MEVAGLSFSDGDLMRRACGKKDAVLMEQGLGFFKGNAGLDGGHVGRNAAGLAEGKVPLAIDAQAVDLSNSRSLGRDEDDLALDGLQFLLLQTVQPMFWR